MTMTAKRAWKKKAKVEQKIKDKLVRRIQVAASDREKTIGITFVFLLFWVLFSWPSLLILLLGPSLTIESMILWNRWMAGEAKRMDQGIWSIWWAGWVIGYPRCTQTENSISAKWILVMRRRELLECNLKSVRFVPRSSSAAAVLCWWAEAGTERGCSSIDSFRGSSFNSRWMQRCFFGNSGQGDEKRWRRSIFGIILHYYYYYIGRCCCFVGSVSNLCE